MSLVERLRSFGGDQPFANEIERLAFEAAAEITRLQKALETAREAAADNLRMRTEDLRAELAQAREDALEEAAKVAEGHAPIPENATLNATSEILLANFGAATKSRLARKIAAAIRRLKDKEVAG